MLHDLGKLSVSNAILEKPGKPDDAEWEVLRLHPFYTWKILAGIPGFHEMSEIAASHHEKLNGKGYFRGLTAALEMVFEIIRKDTPHALDATCVEALEQSGIGCDQTFVDLQNLNDRLTI